MSFDPPFPPPSDAPPPLPPEAPPAPAGFPPGGSGGGSPWDRRGEIGFVNALVETTQAVLTGPRAFYESMAVTGGVGNPLLYAVILGYLGLVATTLYNLVFNSIVGSGFAQIGGGRPELDRILELYGTWGGAVSNLLLGPIWIVIGAFLGAGILHLVLLLLGSASRDFEATFRVTAFAHAINLVLLLPFCGGFIGLVWWVVVLTIGVSVVHRVSTGQALVAVLLPAFVCCCCCAVLASLFVGSLASMAGHLR